MGPWGQTVLTALSTRFANSEELLGEWSRCSINTLHIVLSPLSLIFRVPIMLSSMRTAKPASAAFFLELMANCRHQIHLRSGHRSGVNSPRRQLQVLECFRLLRKSQRATAIHFEYLPRLIHWTRTFSRLAVHKFPMQI